MKSAREANKPAPGRFKLFKRRRHRRKAKTGHARCLHFERVPMFQIDPHHAFTQPFQQGLALGFESKMMDECMRSPSLGCLMRNGDLARKPALGYG
jgi:hypothetical protein